MRRGCEKFFKNIVKVQKLLIYVFSVHRILLLYKKFQVTKGEKMKKTASGKIARMALIGGAFSLLLSFGLVSCSDSSDDDGSSSQNQGTQYSDADNNGSGTDNNGSGTASPATEQTKATAKTYNFAGGENGIVLADVEGWDMASKDVIGSPIASTATTKTLSNGAILHWKGSKVGTLRFRSTHAAGASLTEEIANAATALNYNGGLADGDLSSGVDLSTVDRYVEISVDGAGTVSATVDFKGANESDNPTGGPFKAAFVDKDGKLLGTVASDEVTASSKDVSVTGSVSAAGSVYLVFSRNGAKKGSSGTGGLDVKKIAVTPAE
ncbi:hypothetical protein TRSA_00440 [Treponema saccharophilum]|uniref:Uncharacterized protein n=2 Tax=Treponema saccharophilum TaxID=165 RepID=H7EPK8_9SPIR|nr:hypothetical protein TresaDRAFT_0503 [Treponema saccharophilum DSM 2985]BDC94945.1 hypothetical protein TRSA_00440 [Treponema saccharophilum]